MVSLFRHTSHFLHFLHQVQRKAEDELDHQREKHLKRSELAHIPFLKMEIAREQDAIVERKILRDKEHARRDGLHKQRQIELQQITQAKLIKLLTLATR